MGQVNEFRKISAQSSHVLCKPHLGSCAPRTPTIYESRVCTARVIGNIVIPLESGAPIPRVFVVCLPFSNLIKSIPCTTGISAPTTAICASPTTTAIVVTLGESRCVSGWNHAISQAQTDWNSGQYTNVQNGGNPDCPIGHTQAYCNGYTKGYTYEWNYQWQQSQPAPTPFNATPMPPQQPQQPQCGLGQTIGNDGLCHFSIEGIKKACQEHSTICSLLEGLLLHALGL
jgi:hypothetical protein